MRHLVLATGVFIATASVSGATGGFDCQIADENMTFSVSGEVSRGMGGAILGYRATADIKAQVTPPGLQSTDLSAGLVHHWLDHPELRLHFYAETTADAPFASFDLILKTTATDDELAYAGDYWMSIFDGETGEVIQLNGKVTCAVE